MRFVDRKQKIDFLLELISKENTGAASDLCKRICVSKRTLVRFIKDLRELGYEISFCNYRKTYFFIKNHN